MTGSDKRSSLLFAVVIADMNVLSDRPQAQMFCVYDPFRRIENFFEN